MKNIHKDTNGDAGAGMLIFALLAWFFTLGIAICQTFHFADMSVFPAWFLTICAIIFWIGMAVVILVVLILIIAVILMILLE